MPKATKPSHKPSHFSGTYREIPRTLINTREAVHFMTPQAYERLERTILDVGLLTPLLWNERTGNLISGHLRLNVLDDQHDNDQFHVGVMALNLPSRTEVSLSIFLNNTAAQGVYDRDMLRDILKDPDTRLADMGMDENALRELFGRVGTINLMRGIDKGSALTGDDEFEDVLGKDEEDDESPDVDNADNVDDDNSPIPHRPRPPYIPSHIHNYFPNAVIVVFPDFPSKRLFMLHALRPLKATTVSLDRAIAAVAATKSK